MQTKFNLWLEAHVVAETTLLLSILKPSYKLHKFKYMTCIQWQSNHSATDFWALYPIGIISESQSSLITCHKTR